MSRIGRVGRRRRRMDPDAPSHERARRRAAERLDGPLEPAEAVWLDEHLASCTSCRTVARAYEADRATLRELRAVETRPPRDLWARTATAIERESRRQTVADRRGGGPRQGRAPALGILSAIAVIAVVFGATALSGGFLQGPPTTALGPGPSGSAAAGATLPAPGPTPIAVGATDVRWVGAAADGAYAYNIAPVDKVCAHGQQPDCAPVGDGHSKPVAITSRPRSIIQSPDRNQAVVVGTDAAGDDSVVVIALPTPDPTPSPIESAAPVSVPSATPVTSETPAATTSAPADASAAPTPSIEPSTPPSAEPPSTTPSTEPSTEPPASGPPASEPPASETPAPTAAAALAIVSGVTVVGQGAAYSPDGAWFAFTARPSNYSAGPDIYVWRVGDPSARAVTTDHASVFASWVGTRMLGSRPDANGAVTGEVSATSFFIDPADGTETPIAGALWRPVVDPNDRWSVSWEGTVKLADDGLTVVPATGSLVLRPFVADVGPDLSVATPVVVADGASPEFDVHWDATGTWLAIWAADPDAGSFGRLSLMTVDPQTGQIDRPTGAPQDVAALPGFSIADGRLAWATPPGQEGEGSRVQIVAWSADAVGSVESAPGRDVVVVH
jgi:hypothetical protein